MWSQHFERVLPHSDSKAAVLIIDTQGLFDSEASQGITRVIFAFTALISSNIVYNIKQQLQEDFLSQVALFSSWGLICHQHMNDAAAAMQRAIASSASGASGDGSDGASGAGAGAGSGAGAGAGSTEGDSGRPPYQRLDFLVRDSTEMDVEILSEFEDEMPTPDDVAAICGKVRVCVHVNTMSRRSWLSPNFTPLLVISDGQLLADLPLQGHAARTEGDPAADCKVLRGGGLLPAASPWQARGAHCQVRGRGERH